MPWLVNRPAGQGKEARAGDPRHMVVVTSSVAGLVPSPCSASYAMSKHAVHGFFNTLRAESAYRGLDVLLVCPGPFESEIVQSAMTGAPGRAVGAEAAAADKSIRLSADRVAELALKAMHHRLSQITIGPQPILAFTWLAHYLPQPFIAHLVTRFIGPGRTEAMAAAGQVDYSSIQKLSVFGTLAQAIFGSKKDD
jgi:dehydrogenase/reductase SDR family protein 7